jgi:Amt family ammonium transporter
MYLTVRKPDPTMVVNGFLAGLVAITACSAFVSASVGFLIGAIGGVLVCVAVPLIDRLHIDDPVGAISVHGVNGMFGVLAVGLFADGTYGGGWNGTTLADGSAKPLMGLFPAMMSGQTAIGVSQLMAQLIGMATLLVWAFGVSLVFFKVQHAIMGLRVSPEDEIAGLDIPETGVLAYPAFHTSSEVGIGAIATDYEPVPVKERVTA